MTNDMTTALLPSSLPTLLLMLCSGEGIPYACNICSVFKLGTAPAKSIHDHDQSGSPTKDRRKQRKINIVSDICSFFSQRDAERSDSPFDMKN